MLLTRAKVSDWNSFSTNPKFSESFRDLYAHQTVSFRSNPNQSEAHSKLIRTCNPNEQDWIRSIRIIQNYSKLSIRMNLVNPNQSGLSIRINPVNTINWNFQSESIRSIRVNVDDCKKFRFIGLVRIDWIKSDCISSDYFCLIRIDRINLDWFWMGFGLIRI